MITIKVPRKYKPSSEYTPEDIRDDYMFDIQYVTPKAIVFYEDKNPYWFRICRIAAEQRAKGKDKYGFGLEDNPAEMAARIRHLEEELIDGLMYCEWIKEKLNDR